MRAALGATWTRATTATVVALAAVDIVHLGFTLVARQPRASPDPALHVGARVLAVMLGALLLIALLRQRRWMLAALAAAAALIAGPARTRS